MTPTRGSYKSGFITALIGKMILENGNRTILRQHYIATILSPAMDTCEGSSTLCVRQVCARRAPGVHQACVCQVCVRSPVCARCAPDVRQACIGVCARRAPGVLRHITNLPVRLRMTSLFTIVFRPYFYFVH